MRLGGPRAARTTFNERAASRTSCGTGDAMWDIFGDSPRDDDERSLLWGLFMPTEATAWQYNALCAQTDPEAFFPEKGGSTREAKSICAKCPVREQCLDWALDNDERFGIWGGLSERERRKVKKERA